LAIKVTEVYKSHKENFNDKVKAQIKSGDDIFSFPGLKIVDSVKDSLAIDSVKGSKIIIAGSGMSVGGRVIRHEKNYLGDRNATILLVGYQVPGSLGRKIEEKAKTVIVDGSYVKVRAKIEKIGGYSSHKDSNNLVDFVANSGNFKKVFVAMGETRSSLFLAQRLQAELGTNAIVPEKDREYDL